MPEQLEHSPLPWHAEREEWTGGKGIAICASNGDITLVIDPEHHADERDITNAELVVRAVNHHDQLIRVARHLCVEIENTFVTEMPAPLAAWYSLMKDTIQKAETPTEWIKNETPNPPSGSSSSEKSST